MTCERRFDGVPVTLLQPGYNIGVAASWNLCGAIYRPSDLIISNDDAVLEPGECARLLEQTAPMVTSGGFWRFLIREEAWERVGRFDENIWPAYFEDTDWRLRIAPEDLCELPYLLRNHRDRRGRDHFGYSELWWDRQARYMLAKWNKPDDLDPGISEADAREVLRDRAGERTGHCEEPDPPRRVEWELEWQSRVAGPQAYRSSLARLSALAAECSTVTALGAGDQAALTALLAGGPETFACYDREIRPELDALYHFRSSTAVRLLNVNLDSLEIEPTELLYVDADVDVSRHLQRVARCVVVARPPGHSPPPGWLSSQEDGMIVWRRDRDTADGHDGRDLDGAAGSSESAELLLSMRPGVSRGSESSTDPQRSEGAGGALTALSSDQQQAVEATLLRALSGRYPGRPIAFEWGSADTAADVAGSTAGFEERSEADA